MNLFFSFVTLFAPVTLLSYVFLRFYSIYFNFDQIDHFFKGSFTIALVATIVLTIVVVIIAYFIVKPFDAVMKRINQKGEIITEKEKARCLACYNKLNLVVTVMTVLFYFVGQLAVELNSIRMGNHGFILNRFFLIIAQGTSFGFMVMAIVINGLDFALVRFREKLEIHDLTKYKTKLQTTVSGSIIFALFASVFFFAINMCCAFYGVLYNFELGKYETSQLISLIFKKEAVCVFISSLICSVPFIFILLGLSRRIKQTKNSLNDIASNGNLRSRININMLDDFGDLTTEINHLMDKLSSMLLLLQGNSNVLTEKAEDIASCAGSAFSSLEAINSSFEDINKNCLEQHDVIDRTGKSISTLTLNAENASKHIQMQTESVESISSSISQMSSNIASVAQMAKKADLVSAELSDSSKIGKEALDFAVTTMQEIQSASEEVISFARVINDIAARTNLLSMNAAIEASHAGEFGRGFAVVADEVRSLAESSSKSAKLIKGKIENMANRINEGVDAMSKVGTSFTSVIQKVGENTELTRLISVAIDEQNAGIQDILGNANNVVETVKTVQSLFEQESLGAQSVRSDMEAVIKASYNTEDAVRKSVEKSQNLKNVIRLVDTSATSNKETVNKIKMEISQFHV